MERNKTRNVDRSTFESGTGTQITLDNVDTCSDSHAAMYAKYDLQECPSCGRTLSNRQTRLTDYENL